jgi:hypothetical protein
MKWNEVEEVYRFVTADLGGRLDSKPKASGPLIGGLGQRNLENEEEYWIRAPPVLSAEFDVEVTGSRPKITISGSGMRSVRVRPDVGASLSTTLVAVQMEAKEIAIAQASSTVVLAEFSPERTRLGQAKTIGKIDYGLKITASLQSVKKEGNLVALSVKFANETGGPMMGRRHTALHDFRFTLKLSDCIVHRDHAVRADDVPMYIETVNAVAVPDSKLSTIELSPLGVWDQSRVKIIPGPTFEEAKKTPFPQGTDLGSLRQDFEYAARITSMAMARVVGSPTYYLFQYDLRGKICENLVKCLNDGVPRAVIDNAPTGSGKTEENFEGAGIATIVSKRRAKDQDVGTVAVITEPIRTLAAEQLERLFRFVAYANELLPEGNGLTMGFYMGTQAGKGIPRDPSPDINLSQVPINSCPFCEKQLTLTYIQETRRLVPTCQNCNPHRSFPWVFLTISETEQYMPNIVLATLDKLCYEEGRNLNVHSFFGREFIRCRKCGRGWPVTARFLKKEGESPCCLVCGEHFTAGDIHKSNLWMLIMDEAHVFRGSMGSNAGLYTSAELVLASKVSGHAPLIMASTATVKRADELMRNLAGAREFEIIPRLGDEDTSYFTRTSEHHRKFVFACPNVSNRVAVPKAVASVKKAWDVLLASDPEKNLPKKLPQVVFTKKRQSAENLYAAIKVLGDEDRLDIESRVIHGESTKQEIKKRLSEVENNEIDVLFVTIDLISLGLDIPSIQVIHFDGMPEDYSKFVQAYGRSSRGQSSSGLVFVWLRMNMPGEAYYLEHFRDLFIYKKELMPVIPINKWFPQAIKTYVTPAALQYGFFTDRRGSLFSPVVAQRRFSDTAYQKELEDFIALEVLGHSTKPEDAEIALKYTKLGLGDLSSHVLSSHVQNTHIAGKTNVQALLGDLLPRGIRSQSGEAEVKPLGFSKELMSVRVERALLTAGYTAEELGGEES